MTEEIEREKQKIIQEWVQRAIDDLESAELVFKETDNYEITAYHSHQAIEKILKAELLSKGKKFRFIHDLEVLFKQVYEPGNKMEILDKISYVNSLYPVLRYPTGDKISKEQAGKCLEIAKEIFSLFKIQSK